MEIEISSPCPEREGTLKGLGDLGVNSQVLEKISKCLDGLIAGEKLPRPISLREDTSIDLAHADHHGCISFNPQRIKQGLRNKFGENQAGQKTAASKIFEEEMIHAVHQSCPGFAKAAKLFGEAALEGDMRPLQTAATALSLYRRCMGGSGRVTAGDLLVNPGLLEQGFGELLRMCAQYKMTGSTTELVISPWTNQQKRDLQQISETSINNWCQELDKGSWGLRCRNQYRLLCRVLEPESGT